MEDRFWRVGLIGDIHAEDRLLDRALNFLTMRHVDGIFATGDITDGAGSVDRCCELLEAGNVMAVRGNHDRWLLTGAARDLPDATPMDAVNARSRSFLQRLPATREFETIEGRALVCHGLGVNDMARVKPDDFGCAIESNDDLQNLVRRRRHRWVLNGHSHQRMVRHFSGLSIVNAGTLKRGHAACFLEVDFRAGVALAYEFGRLGDILPRPSELPLFERSPGRERAEAFDRDRGRENRISSFD
jgi:predicted phosphodiesterase